MPKAEKQLPPPARQRQPTGRLLDEAVSVNQLAEGHIKMVIYGQNRVGKTTLAAGRVDGKTGKYVPGSGFPHPLIIIACEPNKTGGASSVVRLPDEVKHLKVGAFSQFVQLANELVSDTYYKTVVIDSATSLQDIILKELLNLESVPEMLAWGTVSEDIYRQRSEKCREGLRPYMNLDKHVVVLAKEKDHNREKGSRASRLISTMQAESFFAADLGQATVGWLHDTCDYIARLSIDKETRKEKSVVEVNGKSSEEMVDIETGLLVRRLRTMYHPNFAAGFRSPTPDKVPEFIDEPTYAKIKKVIDGRDL